MVYNRLNVLKSTMLKHIFPLLILFSSLLPAQRSDDIPKPDPHPFSPVVFEAIPYWSEDTASFDLVVLYRVSSSFLFFSKTDKAQHESYEANGELIVRFSMIKI